MPPFARRAHFGLIAALAILPLAAAAQTAHHGTAGHAGHATGTNAVLPMLPGQDAFGAIQEIVDALAADPATDWSRVDLAALREHLIDMHEVTLRAVARARGIDGGVAIEVTKTGRTREAVRRMVPAHAAELTATGPWLATGEATANGARLTVTGRDDAEAVRIRALGFIGIMATGAHHQPHHLAVARDELRY
ncbi:MAG: hypothetical protein FJX53_00850 [Alphaproteobacteria bacterium]|nr:hypothetical protein [Alphaproteobacteria bacterium]